MSKGHKKSLRSAKNKRSGKYSLQRLRTEANKARKRARATPQRVASLFIKLMVYSLSND